MTQQQFTERYTFSIKTDKIGGGSFGTVYKAYDNVLDREVAIKVSEVKYVGTKEFSLLEEFKAIENIAANPFIANYEEVYRFESFQGIFDYGIMQYYPMGNLSSYLKNNTIKLEARESIVLNILEGIGFLHQNKVVHRDLKPSNILVVNRRGKIIPKITDFGLSKQASADVKGSRFTNSFAGGTLQYSSPEQIKGLPLKLNTDLWSFGAIAYEILTDKTLFEAEKTSTASAEWQNEITNKILYEDVAAKLKDLKPNWQNAIQTCLERDPKQRVKNVEALEHFLAGTVTPTKPKPEPIVPNNEFTVVKRVTTAQQQNKTPLVTESNTKPPQKPKKWLLPLVALVVMVLAFYIYKLYKSESDIPTVNLHLFEKDNLYGYKNKESDSIIIQPQFVDAEVFKNNTAKVSDSKGIYYINKNGDSIKTIPRDKLQQMEADYANSGIAFRNSNFKESVNLIYENAFFGHRASQGSLGRRYMEGKGVSQNNDSAFYWSKKAALKGESISQTNMGLFYGLGNGVKKDLNKSLEWYLIAARNGEVNAMYSAAMLYFEGQISEGINNVKALSWLKKGAETDKRAQFALGTLYFNGDKGLEKDLKQAEYWLTESCAQGHSDACKNLQAIKSKQIKQNPTTPEKANKTKSDSKTKKYNKVSFENKTGGYVSLLIVFFNDETNLWETKGIWGIENKKTIYIANTTYDEIYWHAYDDYGKWQGSLNKNFKGKSYLFKKWNLGSLKGNKIKTITNHDKTNNKSKKVSNTKNYKLNWNITKNINNSFESFSGYVDVFLNNNFEERLLIKSQLFNDGTSRSFITKSDGSRLSISNGNYIEYHSDIESLKKEFNRLLQKDIITY